MNQWKGPGEARVPVRDRVEGRGVDDGVIEPAAGATALAGARAVDGDPADLLADEVEDRHVREHPPEEASAARVEEDAGGVHAERQERVEGAAALALLAIEVGAEEGRVDVRDVDDEHERDPAPRGQGALEAEARRERGEDEREDSRTTERGEVVRAPQSHAARADVTAASPRGWRPRSRSRGR
jgi:hypothetical protein